jgi:hypothetical protein
LPGDPSIAGVSALTILGGLLIAAGIVLTGHGDGLRRVARASAQDPGAPSVVDPRAPLVLRRGVALMIAGLVVAGIGAL